MKTLFILVTVLIFVSSQNKKKKKSDLKASGVSMSVAPFEELLAAGIDASLIRRGMNLVESKFGRAFVRGLTI